MKIAFAHVQYALYWPGRLRALDAALRRRGDTLNIIEVATHGTAYDFETLPEGRHDGLSWQTLFPGAGVDALSPAKMYRATWQALNEINPQVVLAVAIAFPPGAAAVAWARQHRRGVVILDDARDVDFPRGRIVNAVKSRIFRFVSTVLIPAASHAPTYQHFGIPQPRIFYGVDAVDNHQFATQVAEFLANGQRTVAGLELPPHYFLGAGRQVEKKNWLTLLDAYRAYRRMCPTPPWDLVLVGDGPERERLQQSVREHEDTGVHFLPFVSSAMMCLLYAHAGCLVQPSRVGETWGLVVNEAMAAGLPALVSRECGCAQTLIEPGGNGWTFAPQVTGDLALLLLRLAALSEDARQQLGAQSRRIIQNWGLDRFVQGALAAIDASRDVPRPTASVVDQILLRIWKGRFRVT